MKCPVKYNTHVRLYKGFLWHLFYIHTRINAWRKPVAKGIMCFWNATDRTSIKGITQHIFRLCIRSGAAACHRSINLCALRLITYELYELWYPSLLIELNHPKVRILLCRWQWTRQHGGLPLSTYQITDGHQVLTGQTWLGFWWCK